MRELGLDIDSLAGLFELSDCEKYLLAAVSGVAELAPQLGITVRRCYVSDEMLEHAHASTGMALRELVHAKLPDKGSVMSGEFGEILVSILQAVEAMPAEVLDPLKLRLKQDRTKPAPHSDVVQFQLPQWPETCTDDRVVCAEVKAKATRGQFHPITNAFAGSKMDREGRLNRTLLWLRQRALFETIGGVRREHLERFINAIDYPPARREFRAVAVISSDLLDAELGDVPEDDGGEISLVLVSVPNLKETYEAIYDTAMASVEGGLDW